MRPFDRPPLIPSKARAVYFLLPLLMLRHVPFELLQRFSYWFAVQAPQPAIVSSFWARSAVTRDRAPRASTHCSDARLFKPFFFLSLPPPLRIRRRRRRKKTPKRKTMSKTRSRLQAREGATLAHIRFFLPFIQLPATHGGRKRGRVWPAIANWDRCGHRQLPALPRL